MMLESVLASLHLVAILAMVVFSSSQAALCRQEWLNAAVVRCLPANLPAFVEVDLSALQSGQSVHLSDLPVAEGVELVELARGHDLAVAQAS